MSVLDLSCKNPDPPVEPEAYVDIKVEASDDFDWVRIPVTMVEEWINKDGPADMNRTAKVKFPAEWEIDGEVRDIASFINGFQQFQLGEGSDTGDPYDECRIFLYDEDLDQYIISHYGYVGGVGPANDEGVFKMWVYDPADLLKSIQVSKSWGEPSLSQVAEFVINGTDDQGNDVGLQKRSIFDNIQVFIAGEQDIPERKQSDLREDARLTAQDNEGGGPFQIVADAVDDFGTAVYEAFDAVTDGQKQFRINRHNMVDHMNWWTNLIDARWWFEPSTVGPILFIDATGYVEGRRGNDKEQNVYARREFVATEVSPGGPEAGQDTARTTISAVKDEFANIDILENDALYDIKPFNTMYVYGESGTSTDRGTTYRSSHAPGAYTEKYPYVKVTYPPLVNRAGGQEYAAPAKETDDLTISSARSTAVKEFRAHLAENTEGEIITKGEPHALPYDYVTAIPICNDIYGEVEANPITYEINEVHHKRSAGQHYITELGVSLAFDESLLDIEAELREA